MSQPEKIQFSAQLDKLLQLVSCSLYEKEAIFIRELISNSADAHSKLRYLATTSEGVISEGEELGIQISANKDSGELTFYDNGIGMSKDELVNNLGTIARSGSDDFMKALENSRSGNETREIIGQFGIGFYSVFMVADKVTVESRKAGSEESFRWVYEGGGSFEVSKMDDLMPRGTKIVLKLKTDKGEYLDKFRIQHIVSLYSDYIDIPVEFVEADGNKERLNSGPALWVRNKSEISREEYLDFFRDMAHVGGDPWLIMHNKNEGALEFLNLLFIPSVAPFNLYNPDRKCSVKLYVNKVFVTDDNVNIIPKYMRFIYGVVDSSDLPLNISRETLQNDVKIAKIRRSIITRVLSELKKKATEEPESYMKFWDNFGAVLKEGLCEAVDTQSRESILDVVRFRSSFDNGVSLISIDDYISRAKPEQKDIFYLVGSSLSALKTNARLEGFKDMGLEVLLLSDQVDGFWTTVVHEYKGYAFKSITMRDSDLNLEKYSKYSKESESEGEAKFEDVDEDCEEDIKKLINEMKEILGTSVADIRESKKLGKSPVCLAIKEGSMDIRMEKFLREQKQLYHKTPKILEINSKHGVIKNMASKYKNNGKTDELQNLVKVLYAQACIVEGEDLDENLGFLDSLNAILSEYSAS